jgi:hypothetical protein
LKSALDAKADMTATLDNVRFWHLADIAMCSADVCFRENADIANLPRLVRA